MRKNLSKLILLFALMIAPAMFTTLKALDKPAVVEKKTQVYKIVDAFPRPDTLSAPDFTWMQNKQKMKFSEMTKGKMTMLHFWTAWSEPCQEQAPEINEIAQYCKKNDIEFISIAMPKGWDPKALDTGIVEARAFYTKNKLEYPVIFGNDKILQAIGGLTGVPTSFFYDQNGKIYNILFGKLPKDDYIHAIDGFIKAKKK